MRSRSAAVDLPAAAGAVRRRFSGGLRVQTIAPLLASSAHLRFETPDGFVITTAGHIAWERAVAPGVWEYGLKFQEELLEEAIERMLPVAMSVG